MTVQQLRQEVGVSRTRTQSRNGIPCTGQAVCSPLGHCLSDFRMVVLLLGNQRHENGQLELPLECGELRRDDLGLPDSSEPPAGHQKAKSLKRDRWMRLTCWTVSASISASSRLAVMSSLA